MKIFNILQDYLELIIVPIFLAGVFTIVLSGIQKVDGITFLLSYLVFSIILFLVKIFEEIEFSKENKK